MKSFTTSLQTLYAIAFLTVIAIGCQKELTIDDTDKQFPVNVSVTSIDEGVQFNWEPANVSDFEKYVLVRSLTEIPAGTLPTSFNLDIVFESDDPDTTSFTDSAQPFVSEVWYKFYVKVGGRFVESDQHRVQLNNLIITGLPGLVKYHPDRDWVIVGNTGVSPTTLQVIDLANKTVLSEKQISFTSVENIGVTFGEKNGQPVLYWWPGNPGMYTYQLPSLDQEQFFSTSSTTAFSMVTNNAGTFFTTQYSSSDGTAARRETNFSIIDGFYRSNYYDHRTLRMVDPATNQILEAGPYNLYMFNMDGTTGAVSNVVQTTTNDYYTLLFDLPMSPDKTRFIPQKSGVVYDESLQPVGQLPDQFGFDFEDFAFSSDGQFIYSLQIDPFSFNGSLIQKFSVAGLTLVDERRFDGVQPRRLFATNDGAVVFVGSSINGSNNYTIKKLRF